MPKSAACILATIAIVMTIASCSSDEPPAQPQIPDVTGMTRMQIRPAAPGSCKIDANKMCQELGGGPPSSAQGSAMPYGSPNMPTSVEFQIPAGQAIKLMCYYDPQHNSVYKADATPEAALTQNSVDYMKQQGFCASN
jgi:hypothetical protein